MKGPGTHVFPTAKVRSSAVSSSESAGNLNLEYEWNLRLSISSSGVLCCVSCGVWGMAYGVWCIGVLVYIVSSYGVSGIEYGVSSVVMYHDVSSVVR